MQNAQPLKCKKGKKEKQAKIARKARMDCKRTINAEILKLQNPRNARNLNCKNLEMQQPRNS